MNSLQRIAIRADVFLQPFRRDPHRLEIARKAVHSLVEKFSSLKELCLVVEQDVDTYARGDIQTFRIEIEKSACQPICDVSYMSTVCGEHLPSLRKAFGTKLRVSLFGAYREPTSKYGMGCYGHLLSSDDDDDEGWGEYNRRWGIPNHFNPFTQSSI